MTTIDDVREDLSSSLSLSFLQFLIVSLHYRDYHRNDETTMKKRKTQRHDARCAVALALRSSTLMSSSTTTASSLLLCYAYTV